MYFLDYWEKTVLCCQQLIVFLYLIIVKININMPHILNRRGKYLASGCTFTDLHNSYRMGTSTIRRIVQLVCCSIWNILLKEYLPHLSQEKFEAVTEGFKRKANFPHCIGAADAKHIRIIKPGHSGSLHFDYKDNYSLTLLAIADSDHRFIFVDIATCYGEDSESTILKNSSLWKAIQENLVQLPTAKPLEVESSENIPYVFLGNEVFTLSNNLLRPFEGSDLTVPQRVFNYRLSRARRYAECTLAILSNKWHIFHQDLNVSPDFAVDIVKACVILHNFVIEHDSYDFEDILTIVGLEDVEPGQSAHDSLTANDIRNPFADYFVSESGSLPWQLSKI